MGLKFKITIELENGDEKMDIANKIYGALADNEDYINCRVLLNLSGRNTIILMIFNSCENPDAILDTLLKLVS